MKANKLFSLLCTITVLATTTVSCVKSEDFEFFKHPMYLQGNFNPNLGLPLGYAEMTVEDLMNMFSESNSLISIDPNDDLITIAYDSSFYFETRFDNKKNMASKGGFHNTDTSVVYSEGYGGQLAIDLFNNVEFLDAVTLRNVIVNLSAKIKAVGAVSAERLNYFGIKVDIDSVNLVAHGKKGTANITTEDNTIVLENLIQGDSVVLFSDDDVSQLINVQPTSIDYSARLNIIIPNRAFGVIEELTAFMRDSLYIDKLEFNVFFGTEFPLSISIQQIDYDMELSLGLSEINMGDLSLDTSALILEFENGLPVDLSIGGHFVDNATNTSYDLFDQAKVTIKGAETKFDVNTSTNVATKPRISTLKVPLNQAKLDAFTKASSIALNTSISTVQESDGTFPIVSVKGDNSLKVKAYVQVHPNLNINIPIYNASK